MTCRPRVSQDTDALLFTKPEHFGAVLAVSSIADQHQVVYVGPGCLGIEDRHGLPRRSRLFPRTDYLTE